MTDQSASEAILAMERQALDEWSQGRPLGYLPNFSDDITYFDDIAAFNRVDGIEAMEQYLHTLEGNVPPHRYEIVNPKVQVYDDVGILTLRYHASDQDGNPLAAWKATSVYRNVDGQWRVVHAHWSTVKAEENNPE